MTPIAETASFNSLIIKTVTFSMFSMFCVMYYIFPAEIWSMEVSYRHQMKTPEISEKAQRLFEVLSQKTSYFLARMEQVQDSFANMTNYLHYN
jgi:hypothetical protein